MDLEAEMLQAARLHQIAGHLLPVWEMMPQAPDDDQIDQPDFLDPDEQPDFPDPDEQPDFDPEKSEK